MKKWNMIIDVELCENCNNCFMADKDEYCGNSFPGYTGEQPRHGHRWIDIRRRERGSGSLLDVAYLPTMCNQCDNAPCIKAARNGEITKRPDGIVLIDPAKAKGKKELVKACPYGHIWWNEELQVPQKWFFDAHLLDAGWTEPRCAQVCPTGCLTSHLVEESEMQAMAKELKLEVLKPELKTAPRIWYRNLDRFQREHIAGTVVRTVDGVEDCVAEITVELVKDGETIRKMTTDFFGDFKFDGLVPGSGEYSIQVQCESLKGEKAVSLDTSVNVGPIQLV